MAELDKRKAIGTGTYAGQNGSLTALSVFAAVWYGRMVGETTPEEIAAFTGAMAWLLNVGVKALRDRLYSKKTIANVNPALLLALLPTVWLLNGCGTSDITIYRMVGQEPEPVAKVEQKFAGKGCVGVRSAPDAETKVVVKQWGTSDWSFARMGAWLGDVAGNLPLIGGGGTTNQSGMEGPAEDVYDMNCSFNEDETEEEPEKPEPTVYELRPVR